MKSGHIRCQQDRREVSRLILLLCLLEGNVRCLWWIVEKGGPLVDSFGLKSVKEAGGTAFMESVVDDSDFANG